MRDSDGTLIVNAGELEGGTLLTAKAAERTGKPCLVVQADDSPDAALARGIIAWISRANIRVLNVAGPREEKAPGIYATTFRLLEHSLAAKPGASA